MNDSEDLHIPCVQVLSHVRHDLLLDILRQDRKHASVQLISALFFAFDTEQVLILTSFGIHHRMTNLLELLRQPSHRWVRTLPVLWHLLQVLSIIWVSSENCHENHLLCLVTGAAVILHEGLYPCRAVGHIVLEGVEAHSDLPSIHHALQPLGSEHGQAVLDVDVMPYVPYQRSAKTAEAPLHRLASLGLGLPFGVKSSDAIFEVVANSQRAQLTHLHQVIEHIADLIMATVLSFGSEAMKARLDICYQMIKSFHIDRFI